MYLSDRISLAEFAYLDGLVLLRANCQASYKSECRYPKVAIGPHGEIVTGECTCRAKADGRCSHVGCVLYLAEDLSLALQPPHVTGMLNISRQ